MKTEIETYRKLLSHYLSNNIFGPQTDKKQDETGLQIELNTIYAGEKPCYTQYQTDLFQEQLKNLLKKYKNLAAKVGVVYDAELILSKINGLGGPHNQENKAKLYARLKQSLEKLYFHLHRAHKHLDSTDAESPIKDKIKDTLTELRESFNNCSEAPTERLATELQYWDPSTRFEDIFVSQSIENLTVRVLTLATARARETKDPTINISNWQTHFPNIIRRLFLELGLLSKEQCPAHTEAYTHLPEYKIIIATLSEVLLSEMGRYLSDDAVMASFAHRHIDEFASILKEFKHFKNLQETPEIEIKGTESISYLSQLKIKIRPIQDAGLIEDPQLLDFYADHTRATIQKRWLQYAPEEQFFYFMDKVYAYFVQEKRIEPFESKSQVDLGELINRGQIFLFRQAVLTGEGDVNQTIQTNLGEFELLNFAISLKIDPLHLQERLVRALEPEQQYVVVRTLLESPKILKFNPFDLLQLALKSACTLETFKFVATNIADKKDSYLNPERTSTLLQHAIKEGQSSKYFFILKYFQVKEFHIKQTQDFKGSSSEILKLKLTANFCLKIRKLNRKLEPEKTSDLYLNFIEIINKLLKSSEQTPANMALEILQIISIQSPGPALEDFLRTCAKNIKEPEILLWIKAQSIIDFDTAGLDQGRPPSIEEEKHSKLETPLCYALRTEQPQSAEKLIEAGADPGSVTPGQPSPLMLLAKNGTTAEFCSFLDLISSKDNCLDCINYQDEHGNNALIYLMQCRQYEKLEYLLLNFFGLNLPLLNSSTPEQIDNIQDLKYFSLLNLLSNIQQGENMSVIYGYFQEVIKNLQLEYEKIANTPAFIAKILNVLTIVDKQCQTQAREFFKNIAEIYPDPKILLWLQKRLGNEFSIDMNQSKQSITPLFKAITTQRFELIPELIKHGADPKLLIEGKPSALMLLVKHDSLNKEFISFLRISDHINYRDMENHSVLSYTFKFEEYEKLKILLLTYPELSLTLPELVEDELSSQSRFLLNTLRAINNSDLELTIYYFEHLINQLNREITFERYEIIIELIRSYCNSKEHADYLPTLLSLLVDKTAPEKLCCLQEALIESKYDFIQVISQPRTTDKISALETPLCYAIRKKNKELFTTLLENHVNPTRVAPNQPTALMLLVKFGSVDEFDKFLDYLTDYSSQVSLRRIYDLINFQDNNNESVLSLILQENKPKKLKCLLTKFPELNLTQSNADEEKNVTSARKLIDQSALLHAFYGDNLDQTVEHFIKFLIQVKNPEDIAESRILFEIIECRYRHSPNEYNLFQEKLLCQAIADQTRMLLVEYSSRQDGILKANHSYYGRIAIEAAELLGKKDYYFALEKFDEIVQAFRGNVYEGWSLLQFACKLKQCPFNLPDLTVAEKSEQVTSKQALICLSKLQCIIYNSEEKPTEIDDNLRHAQTLLFQITEQLHLHNFVDALGNMDQAALCEPEINKQALDILGNFCREKPEFSDVLLQMNRQRFFDKIDPINNKNCRERMKVIAERLNWEQCISLIKEEIELDSGFLAPDAYTQSLLEIAGKHCSLHLFRRLLESAQKALSHQQLVELVNTKNSSGHSLLQQVWNDGQKEKALFLIKLIPEINLDGFAPEELNQLFGRIHNSFTSTSDSKAARLSFFSNLAMKTEQPQHLSILAPYCQNLEEKQSLQSTLLQSLLAEFEKKPINSTITAFLRNRGLLYSEFIECRGSYEEFCKSINTLRELFTLSLALSKEIRRSEQFLQTWGVNRLGSQAMKERINHKKAKLAGINQILENLLEFTFKPKSDTFSPKAQHLHAIIRLVNQIPELNEGRTGNKINAYATVISNTL